ncbi:hypothetical protein AVEN_50581-1 [Araneus ventricosus]|uniref:Uncharacterized protein n=1 Tax=Araneus ventricosus TaxID=182803 RepID=A0A4Y2AS46_ARAVE|nr:hypothetical protein AVEN_50581-1 [Araneus ventricosus]
MLLLMLKPTADSFQVCVLLQLTVEFSLLIKLQKKLYVGATRLELVSDQQLLAEENIFQQRKRSQRGRPFGTQANYIKEHDIRRKLPSRKRKAPHNLLKCVEENKSLG